jgi:four helix bundle protein
MIGAFAVVDFRNSESWNRARLTVCAILEFTEFWSRRNEYRILAKNIEHLSIAVLDNIAKGYEAPGDRSFLARAANTIDELERELERVRRKRFLHEVDFSLLRENLETVRESLENLEL